MGRHNYLIEGLSGSGKTSVAAELHRLGHHVVHGDRTLAYVGDPATGQPLTEPTGLSPAQSVQWRHSRWIWRADQVKSLAADQVPAATFFCGGSRNFPQFLPLFTRVFVLEVDIATLTRRVATRPP